ncbi:FAD-dependent oxidoreductase [Streptomyces sp. 7-21]|uniref:FAD-dependent oxidoreductase n=1 Tax=Streptomyces sp. 7-21 TaxID=2802283 RepID=UPI00191E914B|nr:FAD-dependent oxidoreductase [Streptomyces sp. 7-21]MBL1065843.1 FAD-dependent oxidoreductase [Streptomyces sp. 7-21]
MAAARPAGSLDRRARCLPPPPGRPGFGGARPRVAVIGGGIAGLTAATALAERSVAVTLYEREPELGGRLAGWHTVLGDGSPATMTRGFHAFFRQYYNLRALLRRIDPELGMLTPLPDYPLLHAGGARETFRGLPLTPPWNALAFAARSPSFDARGLAGLRARAALPLLGVRTPDVYRRLDHVSAQDFLDAIGFPPAARALAFEVFSRSFFADPRQLSAAEMVLMFHIYFLGSREGLLFDVVNRPFPQALWHPLARRLTARGVRLRLGEAVTSVTSAKPGGGVSVAAGGRPPQRYDAVVLALDTAGLRDLVAASPALCDAAWRARVAALRTAPPFVVSRLWLDAPVAPHRPAFCGTSGFGGLDNISVLDRYEDEAAAWASRQGGSVVELHAYAVGPGAAPRAVRDALLAQLRRAWPETGRARVRDERHLWRDDCPLFAVGGFAGRPAVRTPDPAVVVAGDLVRTGFPVALMERAATTGFLAANALLARWGVRGHPLWFVPNGGRSAILRALARLGSEPALSRETRPARATRTAAPRTPDRRATAVPPLT